MKPLAVLLGVALLSFATRVDADEEEPKDTRGRVALGAHVGPQFIYLEGDAATADLRGFVFGADAMIRLSRYFGVAAVFETSLFTQRSDRLPLGGTATSFAGFLEARADTNPDGPLSVRIELGPGYRSLVVPVASRGADHFQGLEPLRLHVGPTLRLGEHTELSLMGGVGFGWFSSHDGAAACAVTGSCADSLLDSDTESAVHFVADFGLAIRGWP